MRTDIFRPGSGRSAAKCRPSNRHSRDGNRLACELGNIAVLRYVRKREMSVLTRKDVLPPTLDELKTRLAPFCRNHSVIRLEVFGALARGERRPGSDVDLLVTFRPDVHLGWDFFDLHKEIEDILGCEVDLLTRRSVEQDENPVRRRSILESTRDVFTA
jgi:uncharacterized protein